jgi:preprotein translocase subunit SecY
LKVNAAGVMPIIFAQAIVLIPMYMSQAPWTAIRRSGW